jgi:hypothetical protein
MNSRRWKVLQAAKRKAERWLARGDVISVGIGQRFQQGAWKDESCIVVKIDWKLSAEMMRVRKRRPLPPWIDVVVDGKKARVIVDLQETAGELAGRFQSIIGSPVRCEGACIGSVSAVVRGTVDGKKGPKAFLISGHVAREKGRKFDIGGAFGVTSEPVITDRLDHCLVEFDPETSYGCALLDGANLTGIRPVKTLEVGQTLYFHRSATGMRVPLLLRHIDISAPFWTPKGIVHKRGLLATDGRTAEGDSGALLFDGSFRAVGTLLGAFANESYFIPCDFAFDALGIQLA